MSKVTVDLKDIDKICRVCGQISNTVRERHYRAAHYQGGCGDSFCWASCDSTSCKPVRARVCAECEAAKRVP